MDALDKQDAGWAHKEVSEKIIGGAFEVLNELGSGFLESVYENALFMVLEEKGLFVEAQRPIKVHFRDRVVGDFFADLLVERKVLVELKAVKTLAPQHEAQIINYLKATGIEVGLLLNFGNPRLDFKRFTRRKSAPSHPVHPVHPCK